MRESIRTWPVRWGSRGSAIPTFNAKRFDEIVLYIAERTEGDPEFGRTKLAKVLFYADTEAFRLRGEALTNAEYQNWEHGPYPPRLRSAERGLANSGLVTVVPAKDTYDPQRILPTHKRSADLHAAGLDDEHIALLDRWIAEVSKASARRIRDLSHQHPGYKMVKRNQAIPYESAFLADEPPSDDDVRKAKQIARKQGWLVGDEWQWE